MIEDQYTQPEVSPSFTDTSTCVSGCPAGPAVDLCLEALAEESDKT